MLFPDDDDVTDEELVRLAENGAPLAACSHCHNSVGDVQNDVDSDDDAMFGKNESSFS